MGRYYDYCCVNRFFLNAFLLVVTSFTEMCKAKWPFGGHHSRPAYLLPLESIVLTMGSLPWTDTAFGSFYSFKYFVNLIFQVLLIFLKKWIKRSERSRPFFFFWKWNKLWNLNQLWYLKDSCLLGSHRKPDWSYLRVRATIAARFWWHSIPWTHLSCTFMDFSPKIWTELFSLTISVMFMLKQIFSFLQSLKIHGPKFISLTPHRDF